MNKTITENKKNASEYFDYKTEIRKRQEEERKHLEKWRKELKERTMSTNTNVYSDGGFGWSSGYLPGSIIEKRIPTTQFADNAIIIEGGTNGSMKVDVPLIVNGRDVMKELDEMRDALLLLKRDVDMESKYPRLKELKDEYEKALEKYKTFDRIKESK